MPSVNWTWFIVGLIVGYLVLPNVVSAVSSRMK